VGRGRRERRLIGYRLCPQVRIPDIVDDVLARPTGSSPTAPRMGSARRASW
jgi:hypothetical protein